MSLTVERWLYSSAIAIETEGGRSRLLKESEGDHAGSNRLAFGEISGLIETLNSTIVKA